MQDSAPSFCGTGAYGQFHRRNLDPPSSTRRSSSSHACKPNINHPTSPVRAMVPAKEQPNRRNKTDDSPWTDDWWSGPHDARSKSGERRPRLERVSPKLLRPKCSNYSLGSASTTSPAPPEKIRKLRSKSGRRERSVPIISEPTPRSLPFNVSSLVPPRSLSPSQASINSSQTFMTDNSSGSNRTITQDSYNKAQQGKHPSVDVFKYLVHENVLEEEDGDEDRLKSIPDEDDEVISDSSSSSDEECARLCCRTPDSDRRSIHSSGQWDSGISMGGDSPELPMKARPAVTFRDASPAQSTTRMRRGSQASSNSDSSNTPDSGPDAVHSTFSQRGPSRGLPGPFPIQPAHVQHRSPVGPTVKSSSQRRLAGYELLAANLQDKDSSLDAPAPLYRKFESLQQRTLLHLQDVIGELEAELKALDESIAPYTIDPSGRQSPQSRRLDKLYPGTMGFRRHQVLDMISYYLGQYNQLLITHKELLDKNSTPTDEQVDVYKTWMEQHQAISTAECGFLDRPSDLLLHKASERIGTLPRIDFMLGLLAGAMLLLTLCWVRTWLYSWVA